MFVSRRRQVAFITLCMFGLFLHLYSCPSASSDEVFEYGKLPTVFTNVDYLNLTLLEYREKPPPAVPLLVEDWNRDILGFNDFLSRERLEVFSTWRFADTNAPKGAKRLKQYEETMKEINFASESKKDYFQVIAKDPQVRTYALHINDAISLDNTNLSWPQGGDSPLPPLQRASFVATMDPGRCQYYLDNKASDPKNNQYGVINTCKNRSSLQTSLLHFGDPGAEEFRDEFVRQRRRTERTFIHVIPNGRVTKFGGRVARGNLVMVPEGCSREKSYIPYDNITYEHWDVANVTHVDEVFVLNHKGHFFHWTVEGLSRAAVYLDFLRKNRQIKIHIVQRHILQKVAFLEALGIEGSRVVVGFVTARVVYLPQGPMCAATVPPMGMTLLSEYFLSHIHTYIRPARAPKDAIVLIHRITKRWLAQHDEIRHFLEEVAETNNMELLIFSDQAIPELSVAMEMFHRAALIVSPHGAGLLHLMFSRPETVLIEAVFNESTFSYVNMCRNLGHVYHGLSSEEGRADHTEMHKPMYIDLNKFKNAVQFYMDEFIIPNRKREFM